jgi:carbonic anhydrase
MCLGSKTLSNLFFNRKEFSCVTKASRDHSCLTQQLLDFQHETADEEGGEQDPFKDFQARFKDFKQRNYV